MSTAMIQLGDAVPEWAMYATVYDADKPLATISRPSRHLSEKRWTVTMDDGRSFSTIGPRSAMGVVRREVRKAGR